MGRKFYIHGTGELRDGKLYCTICGKELPGNTLKQPFPCSISPHYSPPKLLILHKMLKAVFNPELYQGHHFFHLLPIV